MLEAGRVLPLSAYDTGLVATPSIDLLLHYPRPLDAEALRAALRPVLDAFNIVSSRLACLGEGEFALVHDPEVPVFAVRPPLAWSGGALDLDLRERCVDRVSTTPGESLTKITLTPVPGGTLLGFSVSHTVADASTLQEVFRAWSRAILRRAEPAAPVRRRYRLAPGDGRPPAPADLGVDRPLGALIHTRLEATLSTSYYLQLRLGSEEVRALQEAASGDGHRASANEAITAYVLRRYAKQMVPFGRGVRVHVPVDLRSLHPEVEIGFAGNGFMVVSEHFEDAEVAELPSRAVAARLRGCLARALTRSALLERVRMSAHGLEHRQLEWADGHLLDVQSDIVASNLGRLRMSVLDLGAGMPVAALVPLPAPAGFVVLPAVDGGDGVDVQLYALHPLAAEGPR